MIDRSLLILEDWAHNVSFDPVEIDKERGVILEEWRLGLGAGERIQDAQFPVLLKGSRYAERLPIGKPEIIQNVNHDRLKQFYADWYRPDLMAVIAVGDFDKSVDRSADQIALRARSPPPRLPKPRPGLRRARSTGHASIRSSPTRKSRNTTHRRVQQDGRARAIDRRRLPSADGRAAVLRHAVRPARRDRADSRTRRSSRPQTGRGLFVRTAEATSLNALVATGGVERGLTALFTEVDRVARFGFTATELDRQKLNLQRVLEQRGHREGQEPLGAAGRRIHPQLHPGRTDPGHRLRVRA